MLSHQLRSLLSVIHGSEGPVGDGFQILHFFISTESPEFLEQLSLSKRVVRHQNGLWTKIMGRDGAQLEFPHVAEQPTIPSIPNCQSVWLFLIHSFSYTPRSTLCLDLEKPKRFIIWKREAGRKKTNIVIAADTASPGVFQLYRC